MIQKTNVLYILSTDHNCEIEIQAKWWSFMDHKVKIVPSFERFFFTPETLWSKLSNGYMYSMEISTKIEIFMASRYGGHTKDGAYRSCTVYVCWKNIHPHFVFFHIVLIPVCRTKFFHHYQVNINCFEKIQSIWDREYTAYGDKLPHQY